MNTNRFIQLTEEKGRPFFVNISHISVVQGEKKGNANSLICITGLGAVYVIEDKDIVLAKINGVAIR